MRGKKRLNYLVFGRRKGGRGSVRGISHSSGFNFRGGLNNSVGRCFRSPKTTPWASTLISIQRLRDLDFALVESVLDQPPSTQQRAFLLAKNYLFVRKKRRDHYIREARRILDKTSNKTSISVVSQPPSTQQRALALAKMFIFVQKTQRLLHSGCALHFG